MAGNSLAVGCFTVAKLFLPAVDAWAEGREMLVGAAVVPGVLTALTVGMVAARRSVLVTAGG